MAAATNFRKDQWTMLLATMFCYLFFYTGRHNFGWAATEMAADLEISYTMIGWISAAMLSGYALGQFVNGNLSDRYSPRNMIVLGAILSVGANVAISFSTTYHYILVLWALNGYFQSLAWAPGSRLISNWWKREERGKAFGLYTMAAGSSSVVTFLLSILIIQHGIPWPYLFRLPVLFLLFAAIVFLLVARSKPSQKGYPDLYPDVSNQPTTSWMERYRVVLKNKRFLLTSLSLGFESMARYGLLVWVPVHFLGTVATDGAESLWGSLLLPIGMASGAFSFGIVSDKLFYGNRIRSIGMGMLLAAGTMLVIYVTPPENWQLGAVLMFLAGFFVYGPQANFWPLSPEILGERFVGTGVGIMNSSAYLFAALGEPVLGKIIDVYGSSTPVFLALATICFLSAGTIFLSNYPSESFSSTKSK
ncbi:MFS transporter [Cyclobacterium xiamenense]|uniref:MFS transporter n=1 Tax=Cyclobacterium xiamenense TaxID=1297121 RepID=UPI0035CF92E0